MKEDRFDYIVVGAGSAGCALASRLVALLPSVRVALVESGTDYFRDGSNNTASAHIVDPRRYVNVRYSSVVDRGYRTVPQRNLRNRSIGLYRANGVGGCSLMNAMLWYRGFREDWDRMAKGGGWKSSDVEREFEWLEERLQLSTIESNELSQSARKAACSTGVAAQTGDGLWESYGWRDGIRVTVAPDGRRQDVYRALGADHDRVTLIRGIAERIMVTDDSSKSAVGVLLRTLDGSTGEVLLRGDKGEVILCCGAIDTPKLLQLSGIGPPKLLQNLGISVVHPLPTVGENLRDHPLFFLAYESKQRPRNFSPNGVNSTLQYPDVQMLFCDGGMNLFHAPFALSGPWREKTGETVLEKVRIKVMLLVTKIVGFVLRFAVAWFPPLRRKLESSLGFLIAVTTPKSVGSVMIRSRDPTVAPEIDLQLLSEEDDMKAMLRGVSKVREFVRTPPLSDIVGAELTPNNEANEVENIRANTRIYHHSTGSCAMGTCLDDTLRVHGVDRLRVADASSLPTIPRVPTNAASMVVGAKCASLIAAEQN